jgi:hypothetical protein
MHFDSPVMSLTVPRPARDNKVRLAATNDGRLVVEMQFPPRE